MKQDRFKAAGNCIVVQQGGVLYDFLDELSITKTQTQKLARIHSKKPNLDFEQAWNLIEQEEVVEKAVRELVPQLDTRSIP